MNDRMEQASSSFREASDSLLLKITDVSLRQKAIKIDSMLTDLDTYVTTVKTEMLGDLDSDDYVKMARPNTLFFTETGVSDAGVQFVKKINACRDELIETIVIPELVEQVSDVLDTSVVDDTEGKKTAWIHYHYKGFPVIVSLTKLTQLQSDISLLRSTIFKRFLVDY